MKKIYFVLFCLFCGLNLAAQTLPKVTVEDMEGNQIETDSLINGKPFILSFWGVTCKPCLTELNALNEVMDEDHMLDIYDYFKESTTDKIDDAMDELGADYTEEEIRLVRIKFISEMAN